MPSSISTEICDSFCRTSCWVFPYTDFSNIIFSIALEQENYEAVIFSLYFSLKYGFDIPALKCDDAIAKDSCLFKLFTWLYFFRRADKVALKSLKKHAQALSINEFDQNWIFIYETLSAEQLKDDWKPMKRAGISFVKADIRRTSAS